MVEEESGMDELLKLQQQFTRQQEEHEDRQRLQEEKGKKAQGVLQGLRELQFSMTLEQLSPVASEETIARVNALKTSPDTDELRKMISNLIEDIEQRLENKATADSGLKSLVDASRVLGILMDLYFSL